MCCLEITLLPADALDVLTGSHLDAIEDGTLVDVDIPKYLLVISPIFELPLVGSLLIMDWGTLCGLFVVIFVVTLISFGVANMFSDRRGQGEIELSGLDLPVHVREVD